MDFTEKLRLRGKVEEDLYFAELDRQLIKAMHEQHKLDDGEWKAVETSSEYVSERESTK
ncbi:hypothetical protein [Vibrio ponticus]|uniref:hypothetical protein n=1 Tax=Vibrio ponticus TaxID=265668 RepID=UPI00161753D6|nr:hypothetical protein [Vibrio ponticus]